MKRKSIFGGVWIFVILLFGVCILWGGNQEMEYRFQKGKEKSETKQNTGQVAKEKINRQAGADSAIGYNLSFGGHYLLENGDYLFAAGPGLSAGVTLYGGKDVPEKEAYNIYRLKDDVWEVFVSHPPESVNNEMIKQHNYWDETIIRNLIYYNDFLYYSLLYDDEPAMGGNKMQYIYRIPVQGGKPEELALAYDLFYIYNGKIYYMGLENERRNGWECVYWEMEPDGTNRREIYRRAESWGKSFTVGGGFLYVEEADGERITGVNLENGDRRYYSVPRVSMEGIYYENGYLYIWVSDYGYTSNNILRMDVVSGEKKYLADCIYIAWLENGYLYYIWYDSTVKKWSLSALNLRTEQSSTELLGENGSPYLQTVGDDLVININVYKEHSKEKEIYFKYKANTLPLERLDRREILLENP